MKQLLYKIIILGIIAVVIIGIGVLANYYKNESNRYKNNYNAMFDREIEQRLTVSELKQKYSDIVDTLNIYKIKPKSIERIIQTKYEYRDTIAYKDSLIFEYDTVLLASKADFNFIDRCFSISGYVIDSTITITDKKYTDSITVVLHWKRKWFFGRKTYQAAVISNCGENQILNNISVIKKKGSKRNSF